MLCMLAVTGCPTRREQREIATDPAPLSVSYEHPLLKSPLYGFSVSPSRQKIAVAWADRGEETRKSKPTPVLTVYDTVTKVVSPVQFATEEDRSRMSRIHLGGGDGRLVAHSVSFVTENLLFFVLEPAEMDGTLYFPYALRIMDLATGRMKDLWGGAELETDTEVYFAQMQDTALVTTGRWMHLYSLVTGPIIVDLATLEIDSEKTKRIKEFVECAPHLPGCSEGFGPLDSFHALVAASNGVWWFARPKILGPTLRAARVSESGEIAEQLLLPSSRGNAPSDHSSVVEGTGGRDAAQNRALAIGPKGEIVVVVDPYGGTWLLIDKLHPTPGEAPKYVRPWEGVLGVGKIDSGEVFLEFLGTKLWLGVSDGSVTDCPWATPPPRGACRITHIMEFDPDAGEAKTSFTTPGVGGLLIRESFGLGRPLRAEKDYAPPPRDEVARYDWRTGVRTPVAERAFYAPAGPDAAYVVRMVPGTRCTFELLRLSGDSKETHEFRACGS